MNEFVKLDDTRIKLNGYDFFFVLLGSAYKWLNWNDLCVCTDLLKLTIFRATCRLQCTRINISIFTWKNWIQFYWIGSLGGSHFCARFSFLTERFSLIQFLLFVLLLLWLLRCAPNVMIFLNLFSIGLVHLRNCFFLK